MKSAAGAPISKVMSSAFVKEDDAVEELSDRPISPHPNYVTEAGFAQIEAALSRAQGELGKAQDDGDRAEIAKARRDFRYWTARRASAQVLPKPTSGDGADNDEIRFGATVTLKRADGRTQTFRIVGEDEADPAQGTISHASPLAQALFGKGEGDSVVFGGGEAEIVDVG